MRYQVRRVVANAVAYGAAAALAARFVENVRIELVKQTACAMHRVGEITAVLSAAIVKQHGIGQRLQRYAIQGFIDIARLHTIHP
jgi:hypothetical protein